MSDRNRQKRWRVDPMSARRYHEDTAKASLPHADDGVWQRSTSMRCALCGEHTRSEKSLFDGKHWVSLCESCTKPFASQEVVWQ